MKTFKEHPLIAVILTLTLMVVVQFWMNLQMSAQLSELIETPATVSSLEMPSEHETISAHEENHIIDLFSYVEKLGGDRYRDQLIEQSRANLDAYFKNEATFSYLDNLGVSAQSGLTHNVVNRDGMTLFSFSVDKYGNYQVSYLEESMSYDPRSDLKAQFEMLFSEHLEDVQTEVAQIKADREQFGRLMTENESIQASLNKAHLQLSDESQEYGYEVLNKGGESLLSLSMESWKIKGEEVFVADLVEQLNELDGRSDMEIEVAKLRGDIEALQQDEGFLSTLEKAQLKFNFEAVEDEAMLRYEIRTLEDVPIQWVIIDKNTAQLRVKEPHNDSEGSLLKEALQHDEAEAVAAFELPEIMELTETQGNLGAINILVAGKNSSNVDTIILLHIDPYRESASLVSIPRDLYYNDRKINSVYGWFGMREFVKQLSEMTGQRIHHYVLVDMYVFRDLIDVLGGVDVVLEEDLIDPSYRVIENGIEATLHYPAGEHHLNGTEALRIARSRYSTSDYSRAARQQIILEGLQQKARELNATDTTTIIKLINTVLKNTETDLSMRKSLEYFLRFKNYSLERGSVISSGNVLESAWIPVDFRSSKQIEVCEEPTEEGAEPVCEMSFAIYALVPKEDNWDYVRWYIQEVFN